MKPTIPEVWPLVCSLYARNPVGCCLHVLLDDGNVDAKTAQFCVQYAREQGHEDCIQLAGLLVEMSATQRTKLYRWRHG